MSDISLFLRSGWRSIWKGKIIFLFSALYSTKILFLIVPLPKNIFWLSASESIANFLLLFIGSLGMIYITCCVSRRESVTIRRTLQAIGKSLGRTLALVFLFLVLIAPLLCMFTAYSFKHPVNPQGIYLVIYSAALPLSITTAWFYFLFAGIVIDDFGVQKSIKNASIMFIAHLGILAAMGILLYGLAKIVTITFSMAIILIQSNFDITTLATINYLIPSSSFPNNSLYLFVTLVFDIILEAFVTSSAVFAYMKYSGVKAASQVL